MRVRASLAALFLALLAPTFASGIDKPQGRNVAASGDAVTTTSADGLSLDAELAIIAKARESGSAAVLTHAKPLRSPSGLVLYMVVFKKSDKPMPAEEIAATYSSRYRIKDIHPFSGPALTGFGAPLDAAAIEALRRDPRVLFLEQDLGVQTNEGFIGAPSWGQDRIDSHPAVLDGALRLGWIVRPVHVYVVDTGIDTTQSNDGNARFHAWYSYPGLPPSDTDAVGHGTHVAGTIAGNLYGIAPDVDVYSARVFGTTGSVPTYQITAGINYVYQNHLPNAVVNLSLGVTGGTDVGMDIAVQNLVAGGVTVVVAAGNEGVDACQRSPSRVTQAIVVGATSKPPSTFIHTDQVASFSNWGPCLDLYAPGVNILSALANSNNGTTLKSGTSMAAPHVAAAAAFFAAQNMTPAQVEAQIVSHATTGTVVGAAGGAPNRMLYLDRMPSGQASGPLLATAVSGNPMFGTKQNGQVFILYGASNGLLAVGNISNVQVVPGSLALGHLGDDVWGVRSDGNLAHAYWQNSAWQSEVVNVWGGGANPASLVSSGEPNPVFGVKTTGQVFVVYRPSANTWAVGDIRDVKARFGSLRVASDHSLFGVRPDGNIFHAWWNGQWWEVSINVW